MTSRRLAAAMLFLALAACRPADDRDAVPQFPPPTAGNDTAAPFDSIIAPWPGSESDQPPPLPTPPYLAVPESLPPAPSLPPLPSPTAQPLPPAPAPAGPVTGYGTGGMEAPPGSGLNPPYPAGGLLH